MVNPLPPAPMTMCTSHCAFEIINAVWKALAPARPDRAIGGWGKTVHCISSGVNPASNRRFVLYHWHAYPAAGAVAERDGFHTMGGVNTLGGLVLPNVEMYERLYPIRILKYEIRTDSAGAGARRGGAGMHYRARMLVEADYSFRGEGLRAPTGFGVNGGTAGAAGYLTAEAYDLPRYGLRRLPPLELEIQSPGGGGWGSPFDRPPEQVLADVRDEVVSRAAAREIYGVAVSEDARSIDLQETLRLRAARG
jgi:N-methylhydantoinase B